MSYLADTLTAGQAKRFTIGGAFFRVIAAAAPLTVSFFRNKQRLDETVIGVSSGFYFRGEFDEYELMSATGGTVDIVTSQGEVGYSDAVTVTGGSVAVSNLPGESAPHYNSAINVTNVPPGVELLPADAARRYLAVQNNDAAGNVWVRTDGGIPAVNIGYRVRPGETLVIDRLAPTGAIRAWGDIASNTVTVDEA